MNHARRGPGPTTAVAARNGVGFTSPEPFVVELPPGEGVHHFRVDGVAAGPAIAAGSQLRWVVFPEGGGELDSLWDSTRVSLDLQLDDGWLSEAAVTDQYGGAISAAAQAASKRLYIDQWNLRRVDLTPVAGRRVVAVWVVVEGSPRRGVRAFVDDVRIEPAPARPVPGLDCVATTRGTHSSDRFSRGNTAPLVGLPHGGVFGLPMTDASRGNWPYSYLQHHRDCDNRPTIQAFATSHLPSPWMGDRGVFQVMPSSSVDPDTSRTGRALGFDHDDEQDGPHLYRVGLDDGVTAEVTAGEFALGLRFHLPGSTGSVILDHHGEVRDVSVRTEGDTTLVDLVLDDRPGTPPHGIHLQVSGVTDERLTYAAGRLGGYLIVTTGPGGWVDVLVGTSTIDAAQAAENLRAAGDFDTMLARARQAWDERLATLTSEGGSVDQDVSLYSGLYRTFLYPNRYAETAGRDEPAFRSPYDLSALGAGQFTTTHGFWDTYRTAWPLLALLTPRTAGELAQGFVAHFDDGGWTPRWSAPGADDCMTGTTLDIVLADLALRGVPGLDLDKAYRSALKNATVPSADPRVGRKGLRPGIFRGYTDRATPEGLSWTLDNAINDWGTAQLARLLIEQPDGQATQRHEALSAEWEYLARRSLSYRLVFDPARGFFIGRDEHGSWRQPFDPDEWGHDYTETNAWGTAFTAHHDGRGLAELHGGEEGLGRTLDTFFARPETGESDRSGHYGFAIHEMAEARDVRMGMLGLSNQPAHHIPFMYMFSGRHDDAHRVVRECLDRLFVGSDLGQGYPGDEDNGEMSAWYIFASIGLYPLVPGSGTYVMVPPSLRRTVIRPIGGKPVTIEVVDSEPGAGYIRAVRVNGRRWDDISIPHDVLAAGAHLEFELSATPCGWARDSRPVSASNVHGYADVLVDATSPNGDTRSELAHAAYLVDDVGDHVVALRTGDWLTHHFARPVTLSLLTVTTDQPGRRSWLVEYLDRAGAVVASRTHENETFHWAGQTRVFRVHPDAPVTAAAVRFTALGEYGLRQLELFPADASVLYDSDVPHSTARHHTQPTPEGSHAR